MVARRVVLWAVEKAVARVVSKVDLLDLPLVVWKEPSMAANWVVSRDVMKVAG